jgi:hypothetical protein
VLFLTLSCFEPMFSQNAKISLFCGFFAQQIWKLDPGRRPRYLAVLGNTPCGVAKFVLKGLSHEMDLAFDDMYD